MPGRIMSCVLEDFVRIAERCDRGGFEPHRQSCEPVLEGHGAVDGRPDEGGSMTAGSSASAVRGSLRCHPYMRGRARFRPFPRIVRLWNNWKD